MVKKSSKDGYGDDTPTLFFVGALERLIQFPIPKYKLPQHYSDKVELEPIPTLPISPYKPFIVTDPVTKSQMMMVIGYREIYQKRLRIQFLRAELGLPEDPLEPIPTEKSTWLSTLESVAPGGGRGSISKKAQSAFMKNLGKSPRQSGTGPTGSSSSPSPSKGPKLKKVVDTGIKKQYKNMHAKYNFTKSATAKVDTKSAWEKKKEINRNYGRGIKPNRKSHDFLTRLSRAHHRHDDELDDKIGGKEAARLEKEIEQELKEVEYSKVTTMSIDPNLIEEPVLEQDFLRQDIPEIEEDERRMVFVAKRKDEEEEEEEEDEEGALVPKKLGAADERDNEWLILSETDSLERQDRKEAERLYKQKPHWMIHGVSYESQIFIHNLRWYFYSSKFTGRSPYYTRPNHKQKIMEVVLHRKKEIIFFVTSVLLWLGFVLFFQAFIDILMLTGSDDYSTRERNEIDRYFVFIVFVVGQLGVVAVWGILLLLNYGLRLAHYLNIWSVSLTEMETNVGKGIVRVTIYHHVVFLVYSVVTVVSYVVKFPINIHGCMDTVTALFIRNFVPKVLESSNEWYHNMLGIVGIVVHLYVIYCVHITYTIIHILCVTLRSAADLWNLKFALRFGQVLRIGESSKKTFGREEISPQGLNTFVQLPVGTSGYLRQLRVRGTITKLWLHHRLLNGLCGQLGDVFATPLILMFLVQLGLVTWCAVLLFRLAYESDSVRDALFQSDIWFERSKEMHPSRVEDVLSIMMVMFYIVYEFVISASYLSSAGKAFRDGFEFVRRKGLILCNTSHERRLVQSLSWSFSATDAQKVSLLGFFNVTRETMLSFLTIFLLLWSLIIQLQAETKGVIVVITPFCNVTPVGYVKGNHTSGIDRNGTCRKKIWVLQSEMAGKIQEITKKGAGDNLERRRRRRHIPELDAHPRVHWLEGKRYIHPDYFEGNCVKPLQPNQSQWQRFQNHYLHFYEPCRSEALNISLLVPKLFDNDRKVWLVRNSVDCGLVPFPFRNSLYARDCSGSIQSLYDDCGWRKSPVDEWLWRQNIQNNSLPLGKTSFHMKSGRHIECWNIFSAIRRCQRIQELEREDICNTTIYF